MTEDKTIKKLYTYFISKNKLKLSFAIFLSIIGGLLLAYGPRKIGDITTFVYEGIIGKVYGTGSIDYIQIINKLINILLIYFIAALLLVYSGILITNTIQKRLQDLKTLVIKKATKLKLSTVENKLENKNIINIYNEFDYLNKYLNMLLGELALVISIIIGSVYFMIRTNFLLSIIEIILFPALIIMIKLVSRRFNKKAKEIASQEEKFDEMLTEIVYRKKLIDVLNCKNAIIQDFRISNIKNKKSSSKVRKTVMHIEAFSSLIGNINLLLVLIVGVYLNSIGEISLGDIQAILLYCKLIERPIFITSKISNIFHLIKSSLDKIFNFLNLEEEENNGKEKFTNGDIVFNNISFRYSKEIILNDISINMKKGSQVAIVGKTGAGKTTLLKLLLKFYDNYDGEIYINNVNIKNISINELRNNIGIVPQNTWIFNGTIRENILFGNEEATKEQIIEAARKAQIHEFIESLPNKYETKIDEESTNLSQGEKQLICFARVILKNPPIVFLDEATSALDYETEKKLNQELRNFLKDKTSIIIAHKLSTIVNSDKIVVLEDGHSIESGTHIELLNKQGKYHQMYASLSD